MFRGMRIMKVVLLVLFVVVQVLVTPVWVIWLLQYPWRNHIASHLRIQMMQNTAMLAEKLQLYPFYQLIRLLYRAAGIFHERGGEYLYLGDGTLCVKYTDTSHPDPAPPLTPDTLRSVVDTAVWTRKSVVNKLPREESAEQVPDTRTDTRTDTERAVYVVIHGGGFIYGSPDTVAAFSAALNKSTHTDVIVVDYSLAPEHPYPRALTEIGQVLIDLNQIYDTVHLIGASAGANLALAVALFIRDTELTAAPKSLTLLAGVYSLNTTTASYREYCHGPKLTRYMMCQYLSLYLKGDGSLYRCLMEEVPGSAEPGSLSRHVPYIKVGCLEDLIYTNPLTSPYSMPLNSTRYGNLPPCLLIVAENDILYNDTLTLSMRLRNEGGSTELIVVAGHAHLHLAGAGDEVCDRVVQWIRHFVT